LSKLEVLITKALNIKAKAKEERQVFLGRIVDAADDMEDDDWDKLPKEAQKWINAATKAADSKKTIPDFPDAEAVDDVEGEEDADGDIVEEEDDEPKKKKSTKKVVEEDDDEETADEDEPAPKKTNRSKSRQPVEDDDEEEEETETVAKKKVKKAAGKTPAKKVVEKTKTKRVAGALPMGAPTIIKQMILKKPEITKDELAAALEKKGFKTSILTISTVRSDFRNSLRVMKDAGWPKVDVD